MENRKTPPFSGVRCILLVALILALPLTQVFGQIKKPVKWKFTAEAISDSEAILKITAIINPGWHIYSQFTEKGGPAGTEFTFTDSDNYSRIGTVEEVETPEKYYEQTFMVNVQAFSNLVTFTQKIALHTPATSVEGELTFMACTDKECLLPETIPFKIDVTATNPVPKKVNKKTKTDSNKENDKSSLQGSVPRQEVSKDQLLNLSKTNPHIISGKDSATAKAVVIDSGNQTMVFDSAEGDTLMIGKDELIGSIEGEAGLSLLAIFFAGFLGGLAAFVMPCIFPMVPLTISYFTKRAAQSRTQTIKQVILYGLSIIVIYVAIGLLVTIAFGSDALNDLSTNAVFNLFFFVLLVVFAVSLFGAFEITLPSSWINKVDRQSDRSGLVGIFFMAATLALVSFSCTGPIIGGLLVEAANAKSYLGPAVGMFGFSGALALIFVTCALFPSLMTALPKSGGWLNSVKVTLGFLELALALKFLSNVDLAYHWEWFDREVFLVSWIIIFGVLGIYLLGKLRLPGDGDTKHISPFRLFLAMASLAFTIYMVPGLWGAPLKAISAFLPPQHTQDFDLYNPDYSSRSREDARNAKGLNLTRKHRYSDIFHAPLNLPAFFDYQEALDYAQETKRPIMIDFTGHACVNCRKMETVVWSDPRILNRLKNDYVLVQLYVDDKTELPANEQFVSDFSGKQIKTLGNKWSDFQAEEYNTNSQPYYVLLDWNEKLLAKPQGAEYDIELFRQFLDEGLQQFGKNR